MSTRRPAGLLRYIPAVGIWSVNPYRKCAHRCLYCIAARQGDSVPWYGRDVAVEVLRSGLVRVPADAELFVGALTDAYPPVERELGLARLLIQELIDQRRAFSIATKSDLICRDIDLLAGYQGHCDVSLSLCMLDEAAARVLEPGAPCVARRLAALRTLHEAGIAINVDAAPWLPGISDTEALLAVLPPGATIQFAPLELRYLGGRLVLPGREITQEEAYAAYARERERIGPREGVTWKDPLRA